MITFEPMRELMKKGGVDELLNHTDMNPAEIQRIRVSPSKRKYIERYAELLDQLTPKTEE